MKFSITLVLSLLELSTRQAKVEAAAAIDNILHCQNFTTDGSVRQACTTLEMYTPSLGIENNEPVYVGHYEVIYDYWTGPRDGKDLAKLGPRRTERFSTNLTASISWQDFGGECNTTMNGAMCASCHFCDTPVSMDGMFYSGNISVDCSNLAEGRLLYCQPFSPVYFPFKSFPEPKPGKPKKQAFTAQVGPSGGAGAPQPEVEPPVGIGGDGDSRGLRS